MWSRAIGGRLWKKALRWKTNEYDFDTHKQSRIHLAVGGWRSRGARIVARDKTADGHLWYSVSTTRLYCRPSCPSRIANPNNVQLHDSLASAKATGFRPCKRCNPDGPSVEEENAVLAAKAWRIIQEREKEPSLKAYSFGVRPVAALNTRWE